jgi:DNA polymerase III subunit delta
MTPAILKKANSSSSLFLFGNDSLILAQSVNLLIGELGMTKDDYDLEVVFADQSNPREWIASVSTVPFLSEKRVLVIRNAQKLKTDEIDPRHLKDLADHSLIVFVIEEESGQERSGSKKKTFEKICKEASGLWIDLSPDPKKAKEMVRAAIIDSGRTISPSALDLLLEMTGSSVGKSIAEVQKVFLYTNNDQINEREIQAVVVASREYNIWSMIDSIVKGDLSNSMKQLRVVLQSTSKIEDFAFSQLFPLISRQLRLLLQARMCIEERVSSDSIPDSLLAKFPTKPNLASETEYRRSAIMRSANALSLRQIRDAMMHLSTADARLKGFGASFSGIDTIERLIFELASTMQPKRP